MKITINNLFIVSGLVFTSAVSSAAIAADNDTANTAAPVIVTATRFAASIDTAPVNVTTITAEDIANSSADSLADILNYQAGVSVKDLFGIAGASSTVSLGSFGENAGQNTLVLLNGRRLNDLDLDGVNLAGIPLKSIERIEIVHGSSSVLYGDNATSGVINIVTKNAFDGDHASIKLQNGSFQTQRISADLRKLEGNTGLSLAIDSVKSDAYRDSNGYENFTLMGEVSQEQAHRNYGVRFNLSREKVELPGSLDEATYEANPTAVGSFIYTAKESRNSIEAFLVDDQLAAELSVSKKHQEASYGSETDLSTVSLTPRFNHQYGRNSLITGIDLYRSKFSEQGAEQKSYGLYVTNSITLPKNSNLNAGIRHQKIQVTADGSGENRDDNITSADITLSRKHNYGGRNYVRIAKSFRTPVFDEMWNFATSSLSLIKPQTGRHYEIGTRQNIGNGLQFDVNLYRMDLENEIAFDLATGMFGENINLDDTRHDGLNINVHTSISKQTSLQAGYAYRKATLRAGINTGNDIPLVPRTKITLSGQHQFAKSRTLGVDMVYTGKRPLANDDTNVGKDLPSYTQVDLSFAQQFNGWKGSIKVQNASNVNIASFGLYRSYANYYYPLPERALYFTFEGEL